MPLVIDAFDKFKAAMKAVPGSGLLALGAIASKVVPGEPLRRHFGPATVYSGILAAKLQRQRAVDSYVAYRAMADSFNPTLAANAPQQAHLGLANLVSQADWDAVLKQDTLFDSNVKDLFEIFGTEMSVLFIRHHQNAAKLRRIEIVYAGCDIPQVVSMHW